MNQQKDITESASNYQEEVSSERPYLGNMKSKDIGTLPYAGRVGGEMVRRMIKAQEEELMKNYSNDQLKS